jgi:PspA-Associated protein
MIVRISGENQYRLGDADGARLNELERTVLAAVDSRDEAAFAAAYAAMLDHVRSSGERVADDEIETSDVILPPADSTLAEVAGEFTGEGLIPD